MAMLLMLAVGVDGQPINVGLFGGITASQISGDPYSGFRKLGVATGGFMNQHIDLNIYWQAELKYVTRGVYKGPEVNDPTLYRSTYHYVELPLSVHYLHDEKFQVEVGISPDVLLGVVYEDEYGILKPTDSDNNTFGLNVFLGLGYWFTPTLGANLRYTNSAIAFRETQEWNNPQYRGYFHNVMSLTLAYKFKKK